MPSELLFNNKITVTPEPPAPSGERLDANGKATETLSAAAKKSTYEEKIEEIGNRTEEKIDDAILEAHTVGKSVLDEGNRGEESWHNAHRDRNNLTITEGKGDIGKKTDEKINRLREGEIDGRPREHMPEDLVYASAISSAADEVNIKRATKVAKPKERETEQAPSPAPVSKPDDDRRAQLNTSADA